MITRKTVSNNARISIYIRQQTRIINNHKQMKSKVTMEMGYIKQPKPNSMAQLPSSVFIRDERARNRHGRLKYTSPSRGASHEPSTSAATYAAQFHSYRRILTLAPRTRPSSTVHDVTVNSCSTDQRPSSQVNSSPELAKGISTELSPLYITVASMHDARRPR